MAILVRQLRSGAAGRVPKPLVTRYLSTGFAIACAVGTVTPASRHAGNAAPHPDPSVGVINGHVAIAAVPILEGKEGKIIRLDPKDCEVHMVHTDDETREIVYPCGLWFQPPVGRYLFWLEQQGRVSYQSIVYYAGERFTHSGKLFLKSVYPAGTVRLDPKRHVPVGATLRLLSLESRGNYRSFDRRIASTNASKEFRVPLGQVISGIFDRHGRALSLSKPQRVTATNVTVVSPMTPSDSKAGLVAVLRRVVSRRPNTSCSATLIQKNQQIRPTVDLQSYDRIVLAWYEVPVRGEARLAVRCGPTESFLRRVRLSRGAIVTIRADLRDASGADAFFGNENEQVTKLHKAP